MAVKNVAASVLARLKNQSKTERDSRQTRDISFLIENFHGDFQNVE